MALRLTTWNLEWFGQLLQGMTRTLPKNSKKVTNAAGKALQRLQREKIAEEIRLIDPDILCIQEGPSTGNVKRLKDFCKDELDERWTVVERKDGDRYHIRGSQGIFFLVKTARLDMLNPFLLPIDRWREATEIESRLTSGEPDKPGEHGAKWPVNHPWFDPEKTPPGVEVTFGDSEDEGDVPPAAALTGREHSHFRHPQTLVCQIGGRRVDFIGLHLKSKFSGDNYDKAAKARKKPLNELSDKDVKLIKSVEQAAVEARVKLTTEILNVRHYIDNRFRNEPHPSVFVLGDLNDGVGKEYFERRYLFHDLISNLQGDVFFARRFLNHALFDFGLHEDGNFRWTITFDDPWDPGRAPEILLDHIMFTQAVTGDAALERAPVRVRGGAGRVEHDIHMAVNAVFDSKSDFTSDHRPVTVDLETCSSIS